MARMHLLGTIAVRRVTFYYFYFESIFRKRSAIDFIVSSQKASLFKMQCVNESAEASAYGYCTSGEGRILPTSDAHLDQEDALVFKRSENSKLSAVLRT